MRGRVIENTTPLTPNASKASASAEAAPMDAAQMRAQMPIAGRVAYFDHSAVAPLSGPAAETLTTWARQAAEQGDTVWMDWSKRVEEVRRSAAELIGADDSEIVLVPNTTTGINLVAEGLDWREGDNVVILADEYPSNVYPWMNQQRRGVETRTVTTDFGRIDLQRVREACDHRTRVVSVSWVGFSTGYRQDVDSLAAIAHQAGALFFLDAIQGLGVFPLDVRETPIDFLAADGHKWMLGPEGAGMAYVRAEHLDKLRPAGVGAASVVGRYDYSAIDFRLRPTAARFEGGSQNLAGLIAWGASLDLLMAWPRGGVADAVLAISDLACERLRSIGAEIATHRAPKVAGGSPAAWDPRSGVVSFSLPGKDPQQARERCLAEGVALSCRGGRLRISPHAYTNAEDVDRLVAALGRAG